MIDSDQTMKMLFSGQSSKVRHQQLILTLARHDLAVEHKEPLCNIIEQGIDWNEIVSMATRHEIVSLLYYNLNRICPEAVPSDVLHSLRMQTESLTLRSMMIAVQLVTVLKSLSYAGITAVPLKGPPFALSAYGNIALRSSKDIDIFVNPADFNSARELLLAEGYTEIENIYEHPAHYQLRTPDQLFIIELHWQLSESALIPPVLLSQITEHLEQVSFGGYPIYVLSPNDLLLYICLHGFKHRWTRLKWLCDIAVLLNSHSTAEQLNAVVQSASLFQRRAFILSLRLVHDLLAIPIPPEFLQEADNNAVINHLAKCISANMFIASPEESSDEIEFYVNALASQSDATHEYWQRLIRYLTPNAQDYQIVTLPRILVFLYLPLRLIRLFIVHRTLVFKRICEFFSISISQISLILGRKYK
jgi:hypothetical protein